MARTRGLKQNFTFVKGWNTEASPLTFPEHTAQDLDNVVLNSDGSISRRPGVDLETNYSVFSSGTTAADFDDAAIGFFEWSNVSGIGELTMSVTQVGTVLYFHRLSGGETSSDYVDVVDFTAYATDISKAYKHVVAVASGRGELFVCGRYIEPFRVTYNRQTQAVSSEQISIQIRDFEGVDSSFAVDLRPKTADDNHIYNILNAGWPVDRINTMCGNAVLSGTSGSSVTLLNYQASASWPSLADIQYLGVRTDPTSAALSFNRNELVEQTFGNTQAPNGHFIVNAFKQDRATASGYSQVATTIIPERPEAVAFNGGRVFWAGLYAQDVTGNVYFSQLLDETDKAGNCYQEQDPTAEDFNDLLATDGGLLPIPNAGHIKRLLEGPNGIIVFASNGVWYITGRDGGAFSATGYSVQKITDMGCVSGESVMDADGTQLYWSRSGIVALKSDEITGRLVATNITKETIQTGYQDIGILNQQNARGAYMAEEKKAVWLYGTTESNSSETRRFKYNGVLILDIVLGAFYKYSISDLAVTPAPYVCGILPAPRFSTIFAGEEVTVNNINVTVNGENVTILALAQEVPAFAGWVLLIALDTTTITCCGPSGGTAGAYVLTTGSFISRSFHDWYSFDGTGVNYTSYLETGYEHFSRPEVEKLLPYVTTYMAKDSRISGLLPILPDCACFGCDVSGTWYGYANNASYTSTSYTPAGITDLYGIRLSTDKTKMYLVDYNGRFIRQYTLSTAGDISTATYDSIQLDVSTIGATSAKPHSLTFSTDGTKMYITDALSTPLVTYQFTLSTAWNISTSSYDSKSFTPAEDDLMFAVQISPDGTRMIGVAAAIDYVGEPGPIYHNHLYTYTLSTAYDISTATWTGDEYELAETPGSTDPEMHGLYVSANCLNVYTIDKYQNRILKFTLGAPYDITSVAFDGYFDATTEATLTHGIEFDSTGSIMLVADETSNTIYEYDTSTP